MKTANTYKTNNNQDNFSRHNTSENNKSDSHSSLRNGIKHRLASILSCKNKEQVLDSVAQDIRKPNAFGTATQLPVPPEIEVLSLSFLDLSSLGNFAESSKEGYLATARFVSTIDSNARLETAIKQLFGDRASAVRTLPNLRQPGINPAGLKKQITKLLKSASKPNLIGEKWQKPSDFFALPMQDFFEIRSHLYNAVTNINDLNADFISSSPAETAERLQSIQKSLSTLEQCDENLPFLKISDKVSPLNISVSDISLSAFREYCIQYDDLIHNAFDYLAKDLLSDMRQIAKILQKPDITEPFFERVERASQMKKMNKHLSNARKLASSLVDNGKIRACEHELKCASELANNLGEDISDQVADIEFDIYQTQSADRRLALSKMQVDI